MHPIDREGIFINVINNHLARLTLLSGGSGMLGTALKRALAARQTPLLQLVRSTNPAPGQLTWDPNAVPAIPDRERLEGLDAAIHLSGASVAGHLWTPAYKREMGLSRVQSTNALATTLAALRNPPKVLLVASAIGIYGDRGDGMLDEGALPGKGFLADLCVEWEAAARPAQDAGMRVVHARFGVVLDRHSGALAKMLPLFRLGLGGRLGSGRQWMSWVGLPDVVSAVLFALDTPEIQGPMNVTGPAPVTNAEFARVLGRVLHRPAILPAPAVALRIALGQMADEALLASARVFPSRLSSAGFRFAHPTLECALRSIFMPSTFDTPTAS